MVERGAEPNTHYQPIVRSTAVRKRARVALEVWMITHCAFGRPRTLLLSTYPPKTGRAMVLLVVALAQDSIHPAPAELSRALMVVQQDKAASLILCAYATEAILSSPLSSPMQDMLSAPVLVWSPDDDRALMFHSINADIQPLHCTSSSSRFHQTLATLMDSMTLSRASVFARNEVQLVPYWTTTVLHRPAMQVHPRLVRSHLPTQETALATSVLSFCSQLEDDDNHNNNKKTNERLDDGDD